MKKSELEPEEIERIAEAEVQLSYFMAEQIQNATTYFGYPEVPENNDLSILGVSGIAKLHLNNAGDPWIQGHAKMHSKEFEQEAVEFVASLYGIKDNYWGYVTSGGTEGNLYGAYMAREYFEQLDKRPVFLYSESSHYSVPKNARLLYLKRKEIKSQHSGEMDYENFAEVIEELKKNDSPPLIININIGTTMTGAMDQIQEVQRVLAEKKYSPDLVQIHADAALMGLIYPFISESADLFENGVSSLAVSGHKFPGAIHPCGIVICKKDIHKKAFGENWVPYVGTSDSTISGSRNGFLALNLWYIFKKKGRSGFLKEARTCVENAVYLSERLKSSDIENVGYFPKQNIVTFKKPPMEIVEKYQLATQGDMAHVVVMQHITRKRIDGFCDELINSLNKS